MRAALVEGFVCGRAKLPVLPAVAQQVLSLTNNPNACLEDLSKLIQRDQGVAANILKHANSAAYSTGQSIESIDEALMRMGMAAVSGIALAACLEGEGFKTPGYETERRKMLVHAMLSGAFARDLAGRSHQNAELVFVSGLLHTVGKPVVLRLICDMQRGRKTPLTSADVLSLVEEFHARAADAVSKAWNLPEHVRVSAAFDGKPDEAPEFRDEVRLTALAGQLAGWVVSGAKDDDEYLRELPYWGELGICEEDQSDLLARCVALRGAAASSLI
jgi:HD-like signal output (HDOD) protein